MDQVKLIKDAKEALDGFLRRIIGVNHSVAFKNRTIADIMGYSTVQIWKWETKPETHKTPRAALFMLYLIANETDDFMRNIEKFDKTQ